MIEIKRKTIQKFSCYIFFSLGLLFTFAGPAYPATSWGTFLGGSGMDIVNTVAVNGSEVYVIGASYDSSSWEAVGWSGFFNGASEGFLIKIQNESINWGQWLGGSGNDNIYHVEVNGDEIYVAGVSNDPSNWESFPHKDGTFTAGIVYEVFVAEVIDNAGGPSLSWIQFLGGDDTESLGEIEISGDDIYLIGWAMSDTNWETISFSGNHSGDREVFLVKMSDTSTGADLKWGQWLGGSNLEEPGALRVVGSKIYVGGTSWDDDSWEVPLNGFHGNYTDVTSEGFVVKISDGASPSLDWGVWLGGDDGDHVYDLRVANGKIYVGGKSYSDTASWENFTFYGSDNNVFDDGFVLVINDSLTTPTFGWYQWLGGDKADRVIHVHVDGGKVYASGISQDPTGWEPFTFYGTHSSVGNDEGYIVEITDGTVPVLGWGQWIGGSSMDIFYSKKVGDKFWISGFTSSSSFDEISLQGSFGGAFEGFVGVIEAPEAIGEEGNIFLLSPMF